MRRVDLPLGNGPNDLQDGFREIERASRELDLADILDSFRVRGWTPTYTLDASTATAQDVANVLCTFIDIVHRRGVTRRG